MILWFNLAWAELPPADYHTELANAAADQIAALARSGDMKAAEEFRSSWRKTMGIASGPDEAKLSYELGLGWRLAGDDKRALAALDQAIASDPGMVAARYDHGEVSLNTGDLAAAKLDFDQVVRLAPDQWPGHFRLADLAARAHDPERFEHELVESLRCGFSFRDVAADPAWQAHFRDAALGPVMRRLITVYQGDDVMELFESTGR